ncbi:MAG: N-acetyltransferase [Burkholderiaceae bacterium]|nr:MAG: N-acetyltransferase [Burkholderiaceae bacterium]
MAPHMPAGLTLPLPLSPQLPHSVCVRRLTPQDLSGFQAYRSLPELARFQGWSPVSDAQAQRFLEEMSLAPLWQPGQWIQLGIADDQGPGLIGDVGLHLSEDGLSGEIGFTLSPEAQGRGWATAAVVACTSLLFQDTSAACCQAVADSRNLASLRVLQRAGFRFRHQAQAVFKGEACIEQTWVLDRPR